MNTNNERIKKRLVELYSLVNPNDSELSISLAKLALRMNSNINNELLDRQIVDGYGDLGIDAIYVDDDQKKIFLVQSKWKNEGRGGIKEEGMLKMVNGIKKIINLDFSYANSKINSMKISIENAIKDVNFQICCIYIHNGDTRANGYILKPMEKLLDAVNDSSNELIYFEEYTSENIYEFLTNSFSDEEVNINELTIFNYGKNEAPYLTYYGMISAYDLAKIYNESGNKLFNNNIRFYKRNTAVNSSMEDVIKEHPNKFLYYNNGIKILCKSIVKSKECSSDSSIGKFRLESASIVNGAQTTGTIGKLMKEYSSNLSKAKVFIQIIQIGEDDDEKYNITKFTNTQNRIDSRDFITQDLTQERIKGELAFDRITYSYKTGEQIIIDDNTISYDESVVALACYQDDMNIATLSKSNVGKLSEDINKPPYKTLFNKSTDSKLVYDCVMVLRCVEETLKQYSNEDNRKRLISIHGNRFILFVVLHFIKEQIELKNLNSVQDALKEYDFESEIPSFIDKIGESICKHFSDSYPANIFKNATKCKKIYDDIRKEN